MASSLTASSRVGAHGTKAFPRFREPAGYLRSPTIAMRSTILSLVLIALSSTATARCPVASDTCRHQLRIPADLDVPTTPHFDTLIVRGGCSTQLLFFPRQGTSTTYRIFPAEQFAANAAPLAELGFHADEEHAQWLDVTDLPRGTYTVWLLACGNGGFFTLRVE